MSREQTLCTEVQLRIDQARFWALKSVPWYGTLAMRLSDQVGIGMRAGNKYIKTAATDGERIYWNAPYIEALTDAEIRFALLHETLHCAHLHFWRLPATERGNRAGDYAINLILTEIGGTKPPSDWLYDPRFAGLAEEEIYALLQDSLDQESEDTSGGWFLDPANGLNGKPSPEESQDLKEEWEAASAELAVAMGALGQGKIPTDLESMLARVRARPVDWRAETVEFLRDAVAVRNDWSRASRRHSHASVLHPRRRTDQVGSIICVRDTSGSIDRSALALFSELITSASAELNVPILVVDADASVHTKEWLAPGEECSLKAKGGGGTDFRPVFAMADKMVEDGESVSGIVYLTDLMGSFPDDSNHATLWVVPRRYAQSLVPFGRVIAI